MPKNSSVMYRNYVSREEIENYLIKKLRQASISTHKDAGELYAESYDLAKLKRVMKKFSIKLDIEELVDYLV